MRFIAGWAHHFSVYPTWQYNFQYVSAGRLRARRNTHYTVPSPPPFGHADEHLKKAAQDRRQGEAPAVLDIIVSSMTAKLIASVLTYPHEVLRSRMQDVTLTDGKPLGLFALIRHIIRKEGVASLYSGIAVNCIRIFPATISTFLFYEFWSKKFESWLV